MKNQLVSVYYIHCFEMLEIMLPQFIDICFTANEVNYILKHLRHIKRTDSLLSDSRIFEHMYNRISLSYPGFKEAWEAIEKCNGSHDELIAIEEKYKASARIAMLVMDVRSLTYEWREDCPVGKVKKK